MNKKVISIFVCVMMISGLISENNVRAVESVSEEITTEIETVSLEKADIQNCTITGVENKTYSGTQAVQNIEVKNGSTVLEENVDFTATYENAVNVGIATLIITGIGNYTGSVKLNYSIEKKKIKAKVVLKKKKFAYSKKAKYKPAVVVKDGKTIIPKSNYKVTYPKTKGIGTYTVKVKLKGNYSGTGSAKFNVVPYNTKIASLKGIKGGFSILWKGLVGEKFNQISGYEVICSTSKSFTKKKSQKCSKSFRLMEVRKLKSKKVYYVKMRTFKIVGKKFIYSSWSSAKKVITK